MSYDIHKMQTIQTIYFDDSGFTGNNLLNPEQPSFVYASAAISPMHASHLHSEVIRKFKIESKELKGKKLVNQVRGRKAITWLLEECKNLSRIAIFHKKYSLACKFFEYIFEPVLARNNLLFYSVGFHEFIATILYITFEAKHEYAEDIFIQFEELMKTKELYRLENLLSPIGSGIDLANPIGMILTFALCHRACIEKEIKGLTDIGKWVLELTTTALFGLLGYWGEKFESLEVYCDKSKPLETEKDIFNVMLGRVEKKYQRIGTREFPMTFNLSSPINLIESHTSHGIQIADVLASSIAYALKNPSDNLSKKWLKIVNNSIDYRSVFPQKEKVDLNLKEPFVNSLILHELVDRTIKGEGLFFEMAEFIEIAGKIYDDNLPLIS